MTKIVPSDLFISFIYFSVLNLYTFDTTYTLPIENLNGINGIQWNWCGIWYIFNWIQWDSMGIYLGRQRLKQESMRSKAWFLLPVNAKRIWRELERHNYPFAAIFASELSRAELLRNSLRIF